MTIKESLPCYLRIMDHSLFQNPKKQPIEELKIKYVPNDSSYEELIPALDQKWCNKSYVFTLYIPPPSKNTDEEFAMGSKEDWLERMKLFIGDTNFFLQLDYHRFWSEVMYNNHSLDGISSFLQNAPPFYLRDQIPQDKEILKAFKKAQESVFLVLMRLTTVMESETCWMKNSTLSNILYNHFVISLPQLLEISLVYASDNFKEVTELINRVIKIQPKYVSDIEKSTPFICEVFGRLENQLASTIDDIEEPSMILNCKEAITSVEVVKLISLMLDIGYSLATFLEVCPQAGAVFHEQQLEPRIATFYGSTIPVLNRHLDSQLNNEDVQKYINYEFKLSLCRHQLISAVHGCLTSYLSSILEERDHLTEQELKIKVDCYLNTLSECLCSDHVFVRDYNSAFPIQRELKVLAEICPDIDSVKCGFIEESVLSLYDLPPEQINSVKQAISVPSTEHPSTSINHISQYLEEDSSKKVSGVELESLISEVKDILPHLGDGFVATCLEHFKFVSADVINSVLENTLPDSLTSLDPEMAIIPPEDTEERNGLPERINIYDNDEFDVMTRDKIDTNRIHRGKRQEKHKNLSELLDDKSHVNQLRDVYTKLSLVEYIENVNEYEDEYDDTYDDLDVPVGNEGETEQEERRAFVVPRVLQQYKKSVDETLDYGDEEEEKDESEGAKADFFIENPADVRARAEQRRLDMRGLGSGGSRAAFHRRDVVGKPKGQGQEKEVTVNREHKNAHKSSRGNHNRRAMADKKRRQGLFPS